MVQQNKLFVNENGILVDKIAVTTPGAQLAGFPGPRGAMRVGPGVSVPVFAVPGKQNPTWVRIRPNNEGYPPHLTQLSNISYLPDRPFSGAGKTKGS